jgi:hypothetical protein
MKQLILIIIIFFSLIVKLCSQEISYAQSVENVFKRTVRDFDELFYKELGVTQRVYYNCSDTINNQDCDQKRKIFFDINGQIITDTTFTDTLFSSTNRLFELNKITIVKTYPQPALFKYNYKTTVDSLLIDSLRRPIKFFENGEFQKSWEYDNLNRLICYCENPDRELSFNKRTYQYSILR